MKITKTTLRRIIKEELDAVMNEDRAEHVAGIEAKIKRLEAEIERAQERRDEIGYDPAADDPRTSKTYRELGVRIENMEDKLEVLRQQRAELSMNEEDENVARARKAKHIGPAFDVKQNRFQLDPEYQKGAEAMRKRVAKLKGKMNEDEGAPVPFEEAKALAIKEMKAAQAALTYAIEHIVNSTGGGTYWEETEELLDKLEHLMERFSREEPW